MRSAWFESKARARHEIAHRLRDEDFARSGKPTDARADMDRDSRKIVADDLAFPSVQAAPDLEPERVHRVPDGTGTANGAGRSVERCEEAIAGGLNLAAAVLLQDLADLAMERPKQFAPRTVAKLRHALGRAHNVGEQHGGEHALWFVRVKPAGKELLDLIEDRFAAVDPIGVVDTTGPEPRRA
jgi:hypothetical protein